MLELARECAGRGGDVQRERFGSPGELAVKDGNQLVTEVDLACEREVLGRIQAAFPAHGILSEEAGAAANPGASEQWIVDPLDGTTNFAHGLPIFACAVAYARDGRVEASAVSVPMWDQLYWAARGGGAFCNGQPLRVSSRARIEEACLGTGFGFNPALDRRTNLRRIGTIASQARALRRTGSAVVEMCLVADGRFDGFWDFGLQPWDMAAPSLIISEAGGRVEDVDGEPWRVSSKSLFATNGHVHEALLGALLADGAEAA